MVLDYFPETSAFLRWVEDEQKKGLIDIKIVRGASGSQEEILGEVNSILRAETVSDPDFF